MEATGRLSKQISGFIRKHYEDFLAFDDVKIYYDNGQVEVGKILSFLYKDSNGLDHTLGCSEDIPAFYENALNDNYQVIFTVDF